MKKVLVFGGTRFFGKRLVELLIKEGYDVTIATRGKTGDSFGSQVSRVILDRSINDHRWDEVSNQEWDIVFDNICYSSNDAEIAMQRLAGKVGKYVFTSSLSVYEQNENPNREIDWAPMKQKVVMGGRNDFSYPEGKRQAEGHFTQSNKLPVVSLRFPIVLGEDDYTRRLHFHIEKVQKGEEIALPNIDARLSFISAEEAATALFESGINDVQGPLNMASKGSISLRELLALIEKSTKKKAIVVKGDNSPFGVEQSWTLDLTRAKSENYTIRSLKKWLPALIKQLSR